MVVFGQLWRGLTKPENTGWLPAAIVADVNLHPDHRIPLMEKVEQEHMQGSKSNV